MATLLLMPSLSPTMEVGVISSWKKKAGDKIEIGEVLAEIETDKAVMEWEMADEGFIRQLLVQTGQEIPVGTPIAVLADSADEDISALVAQAAAGGAPAPAVALAAAGGAPTQGAPKAAPVAAVTPAPAAAAVGATGGRPAPAVTSAIAPAVTRNGERVKISPYGRKLAVEHRVDWRALAGSGPGGRIVAQDVHAAVASGGAGAAGGVIAKAGPVPAAAPAPGAAFEDLPLNLMRKAIARKMAESKQTVPHFQATRKVRMERMLDARAGLKQDFPDLKVTVNDLLIKACAAALRQHPVVNSQFLGDRVRRFHTVDIAVAVGTDDGLITPVLRNVDQKGLLQIAAEMRDLARKARERKLAPEEYTGGTFTISNLGMFGVTEFNAIINTPQACILAVSAVLKEPVVEEDKLAIGHTMNITLSSDHRVVDGVAAAKFLDTLTRILQNPAAMLL
jgi:pyruvate dehydrogenase E2 component (dihydrolipoamide acetyltransferase)